MNNIIIIFIIILKLMFVINLSNFKKRYSNFIHQEVISFVSK